MLKRKLLVSWVVCAFLLSVLAPFANATEEEDFLAAAAIVYVASTMTILDALINFETLTTVANLSGNCYSRSIRREKTMYVRMICPNQLSETVASKALGAQGIGGYTLEKIIATEDGQFLYSLELNLMEQKGGRFDPTRETIFIMVSKKDGLVMKPDSLARRASLAELFLLLAEVGE